MALKLSIFTTITNPTTRGDAVEPAINSYLGLADEVVIVNGGTPFIDFSDSPVQVVNYHWPKEFNWPFIGEQFQRGYEACTGDWVIHCDLDMIFHEKDYGLIRQTLERYPKAPAVSFLKWQFIQPHKYNLKSRLPLAVNKGVYSDRIKFSGGGDLCQPTLDGNDLNLNDIPNERIAFYNYEHILKTERQIIEDIGRMDRAYHRHFGKFLYSDTERTAYEGWLQMAKGRNMKPQKKIPLSDHPKVMQETIKNLKPENFGYSGFGELEVNDYAKS